MNPQISLVIPAWNEARRLPASLEELTRYLEGRNGEALVVVEPCADETLEIALRHAAVHPQFRVLEGTVHRGKGSAVRRGVLEATGDYVFYMDADLSVPLREVDAFLAAFGLEPDVCVLLGNRAHARSRITRRQSLLRRNMGRVFNGILNGLGLASLHDTQCGFKAFRREAAHRIFACQQLDGFAFDVEVLLLAEAFGYQIRDLPVEWMNSPDSRVSIVGDSLRMLWDSVRVRALVTEQLRKIQGPV
jgi:dolichyl-phosphate beta-glucosyltransferase